MTAPVDFVSAKTSALIEDILATLDTATQDCVMTSMHNKDGDYTWVSSDSEELLGYKPKELIGRNAWELIHPDDHPDTRASQWTVQNGEPVKVVYRLKRKDGKWRVVESTAWESPDFGTVVVTKPA